MSERIFEALAIVSLNGFSEDIKRCAYLNKSTYEDPYFLDTLGDSAYRLLKGAAAVEDTARMQWILDNGRIYKAPIGSLVKWCINERLQNSAIWLLERFDILDGSFIWTEEDVSGFYPLIDACHHNQMNLVMWLLNHGVNPNDHDGYEKPWTFTPLHHTTFSDNIELFNLLLEWGADINLNGYVSVARSAIIDKADAIVDRCIELGCYDKDLSPMAMTVHSRNIIAFASRYGNHYAMEKLMARQKSLGFV